MRFTAVVILAGVAAVLAIIELGLTGYLVGLGYPGSQIGFMLFNSLWSLVVLAYVGLTPVYYDRIFNRIVAFGLEVVTLSFWFAGSIALAVLVPASTPCGVGVPCNSTKAAIAFGFFLWVAFTGIAVIDGLEVRRISRGGGGVTKPMQPSVAARV